MWFQLGESEFKRIWFRNVSNNFIINVNWFVWLSLWYTYVTCYFISPALRFWWPFLIFKEPPHFFITNYMKIHIITLNYIFFSITTIILYLNYHQSDFNIKHNFQYFKSIFLGLTVDPICFRLFIFLFLFYLCFLQIWLCAAVFHRPVFGLLLICWMSW